VRPDPATVDAARSALRGVDVVIEPRQLWPRETPGRRGRIAGIAEGRALAFADDPAWIDALGDPDGPDHPVTPELAEAVVAVLARWSRSWQRPVAVVAVPSRRHPRRVRSLAEHLAARGRLPLIDALRASGPPPPRDVASGARSAALLTSLQTGPDRPPHGPILLVDDTYRTGWTMTVAATLLVDAGATQVLPLVLHRLP
jgi:ATP-dependent DNA helicase RecQ